MTGDRFKHILAGRIIVNQLRHGRCVKCEMTVYKVKHSEMHYFKCLLLKFRRLSYRVIIRSNCHPPE